MIRRLCAILAATLVAGVVAGSAVAASGVRLTGPGPAAFPVRTFVLTLPSGERLQPSRVTVRENGHGVIGLTVTPASAATGRNFGTVLAIDASNSMQGRPIEAAMAATRAFAAGRNLNQQLALLTFNSENHLALPFSRSQSEIAAALTRRPPLAEGTHLYDAVAQGVALLQAQGIDSGSVVLLSDGADVGSSATLDDIAKHALDANVRIFTVGLRSDASSPGPLRRLATLTGGTYSEAKSPEELEQIFRQLGLRLARQYVVRYHSIARPSRHVDVAVHVEGLGNATAAYTTPAIPTVPPPSPRSWVERVWLAPATMITIALLIPLLLGLALLPSALRQGSTVRTRMADFVSLPLRNPDRKPISSRIFVGTERGLERTRWWTRFNASLELADVRIPPVQIVAGTVILTLLAMWGLSLIALPLALLGLSVPLFLRMGLRARLDRKRRAFAEQLPDNLDVLASGLRAGHSLVGALAVVVNDAPEPSHSEFQRVVADEQLGVALQDALEACGVRMKSRDMQQVALVASLQSDTGGNSAEVLDRVTDNIRERAELRRLVRTLTAQGRLARWIVSLLPIGLLVIIALVNRGYITPLFTHPGGLIALTVAGLMIVAGSIVIGRIVDIEV